MSDTTELEKLITRLATIDYSQGSEQATREMAVNPVIGALGWDTFDPNEVAREYSVRGGRVDYCLRGRGKNLVLVEVKKAGTDLAEHQEQLLRYAFDEGVPLAALTDGLVWWLYLPMAGGSWEQRRFLGVDFREQEAADATASLSRFLDREASIRGDAQREAQREFENQERQRRTGAAIEAAWERVLGDPEGLLIDLIADVVRSETGDYPDHDQVHAFLLSKLGRTQVDATQQKREPAHHGRGGERRTRRVPPASDQPAEMRKKRAPRRIAAFELDGNRHQVAQWQDMLVEVCNLLIRETGRRFPALVSGLQGRVRPRFSRDPGEYLRPRELANGLFIDVNLSSTYCERHARDVLVAVRGNDNGFRVELAE